MEAKQILDSVRAAKVEFGPKCGKYAGAVTIEVLRKAIKDAGYNVSPRDSFICGVPIEFDLLVVRPGVAPRFGCLYQPGEVVVAFEIKNSGSFGKSAVESIKANFEKLAEVNDNLNVKIECCYITLSEGKRYKWAVKTETLGYPAFTLSTHMRWGGPDNETGEWRKLLDWLGEKVG
jgi:hypothetical protein